MVKNFSFFAAIAILMVLVGYWFVQKNREVPFAGPTEGGVAFFAGSIKVDLPRPGEYIKGTLFNFQGRVQSKNENIFIKITDSKGIQVRAGEIKLKNPDSSDWKSFNEQFNLVNHSGWFQLEAYERDNGVRLANFKIKIVPSI